MPTKTKAKNSKLDDLRQQVEEPVLPARFPKNLCDLLALSPTTSPGKTMLKEVQAILSRRLIFREILRDQPRPAHVRASLSDIKTRAEALLKPLKKLDAETQMLLMRSHTGNVGRKMYGDPPLNTTYDAPFVSLLNLAQLLDELEMLASDCTLHLKNLQGINSRHAPKTAAADKQARKELRELFDKYATKSTKHNCTAFVDFAMPSLTGD